MTDVTVWTSSLDWVDACRSAGTAVASAIESLEVAFGAELGTFATAVATGDQFLVYVLVWSGGNVDLGALGLTDSQIARAFAADGEESSLRDALLTESPSGQSWSGLTTFPGRGQDGGYSGGGFIMGSDGQEYAIVVPTLVTGSGTYTADEGPLQDPDDPSVANLGGNDSGWNVVEIQSGIERFYDDATWLESAAVLAAGTTNLVGPVPPDSGLDFPQRLPGGVRGERRRPPASPHPTLPAHLPRRRGQDPRAAPAPRHRRRPRRPGPSTLLSRTTLSSRCERAGPLPARRHRPL